MLPKQDSFIANDSSPHTRGRYSAGVHVFLSFRFIPSYKGQTINVLSIMYDLTIHPLLRGADLASNMMVSLNRDSSPPARGRLEMFLLSCDFLRFIPSCEGQTSACCSLACFSADSSPPARGRPRLSSKKYAQSRFIPSCEGQTLSVYAAFSRLKHFVVQFAQMLFLPHPHLQYAEKSAAFSFFK